MWLVTEKDGTAWVCYLRNWQQEHGKRGKDGKVFIDTLMLPPCLLPSYRSPPDDEKSPGIFYLQEDFEWTIPQPTVPLARLWESRSARQPISCVCISARPPRRRWRTKSSVCCVRKSAECDFFVNLMKKSLTFRLWQNSQVDSNFLRRTACSLWH